MGAIGRVRGNGDLDLALTIRTFMITADTIHLWVGGGIVWDSGPLPRSRSLAQARPLLDAVGAPLPEATLAQEADHDRASARRRRVGTRARRSGRARPGGARRGLPPRPGRLRDPARLRPPAVSWHQHLERLERSAAALGLPHRTPANSSASPPSLSSEALRRRRAPPLLDAGAFGRARAARWRSCPTCRHGSRKPGRSVSSWSHCSTLAARRPGSWRARSRRATPCTSQPRRRRSASAATNAVFVDAEGIVLEGPVTNVWWRCRRLARDAVARPRHPRRRDPGGAARTGARPRLRGRGLLPARAVARRRRGVHLLVGPGGAPRGSCRRPCPRPWPRRRRASGYAQAGGDLYSLSDGEAPPRRHGPRERRARARADRVGLRGACVRRLSGVASGAKRFAVSRRRSCAARCASPRPLRCCPRSGVGSRVRFPFERPSVLAAPVAIGSTIGAAARRSALDRRARDGRRARVARPGRPGSARWRARRVPRGGARLDRDVRAGRAGVEGARTLRLPSRRAARPAHCRSQCTRREGTALAARRSAGRDARRRGRLRRGVRLDEPQPREPARPRARRPGTSCRRSSRRRSRRPTSCRSPRRRWPPASSRKRRRRETTDADADAGPAAARRDLRPPDREDARRLLHRRLLQPHARSAARGRQASARGDAGLPAPQGDAWRHGRGDRDPQALLHGWDELTVHARSTTATGSSRGRR